MYFHTAGIEVNPLIPPLIAFAVSFFTSMGGVSGAFLLLPFQMSFLGFTTPSVSATNQLYNIVAIPAGVLRYIREGRMVWPLTFVVIVGTLPGVLLGAIIRVKYLPDPRHFKLFAAGVLLWIGYKLLVGLIGKGNGNDKIEAEKRFQRLLLQHRESETSEDSVSAVHVRSFSIKRISYEFYGEVYDFSTIGILSLSIVVGIVGGIYGIGGGSIIAPFFVAVFGLPVYTIAGAALMGTFVTSIAGVAFYQIIAPLYPEQAVAPDWGLGLLFGLGGVFGMYFGARCQKYFSASFIKWMLCGVIVCTAGKYVFEFLF